MKKALVLAMVCALGLGAGAFAQGVLSGSWGADICINVQSSTFDSFESTLTVEYSISGWTFASETVFDMAGWQGQSFYVDGILGAFTIASDLVFYPQSAAFGYWHTAATVNIAGVALNFETILASLVVNDCGYVLAAPGGFGMLIGVSGGAADLQFSANLYISSLLVDLVDCDGVVDTLMPADDCNLAFTSIDFSIQFPFNCIELVDVSVAFSCVGFDGITFTLTGIVLPNLPWIAFSAELTFEVGTGSAKTLVLKPSLDLGDFTCVTIYASLCHTDPTGAQTPAICDIVGLNIRGIGLEAEFNGCTFTSLSSLEATYNETLIGYAQYWEKFCISCGGDSCCGGAFSFDVCTYFDAASLLLFDWGMTTISLEFGISSNFDLNTSLKISELGFTEWCVGFTVTW
jgi:hypothetical protein